MIIRKLKLRNFKSFRKEIVIDFERMQGIWHVSGLIGSGKTSIGEAIIFALYGTVKNKSNPDLISWGEKHGLVEVWCESKGNNIHILREINLSGQSPIQVEVNGVSMISTNKRDAQSRLEDEYYDIQRSTMEQLCVISFNNFKSLSTLNPKDTKIFLDNILGLGLVNEYTDITKGLRNEFQKKLDRSTTKMEVLRAQLERMKRAADEILPDINELKNSRETIKNEISDLEQDFNVQSGPKNKLLSELRSRLTEIKTLGKSLANDIKFIRQGTCPTCGASIDQSHLVEKEARRANLLNQYSEVDNRIKKIEQDLTNLAKSYREELVKKREILNNIEKEIGRTEEKIKIFKDKSLNINELESEIREENENEKLLYKDVNEYDQLLDIFVSQVRSSVLQNFIPSINFRIKSISEILGIEYVPKFDSDFKCSICYERSAESIANIPISSLSTGQLKTVDMIIILSIISSLISKISYNVIFLDELFSNLDSDSASNLIDVFRNIVPKSASIMLVSHQPIDEALIDGRLNICLANGNTEINLERFS